MNPGPAFTSGMPGFLLPGGKKNYCRESGKRGFSLINPASCAKGAEHLSNLHSRGSAAP
jgi:hypothetical protein